MVFVSISKVMETPLKQETTLKLTNRYTFSHYVSASSDLKTVKKWADLSTVIQVTILTICNGSFVYGMTCVRK